MKFSFHPDAEEELVSAVDYYEEREPGLGYDFATEVFTGIQNIINYPTAWPVMEEDIRRCLINRFPFGIVYTVEQGEIFVLAIMHLRRHPDYWKERH